MLDICLNNPGTRLHFCFISSNHPMVACERFVLAAVRLGPTSPQSPLKRFVLGREPGENVYVYVRTHVPGTD